MKSNIFIISIIILLFSTSCENFLEEIPKDIISPSNYFNSESDARAAITGIYAILKNNSVYGQLGLDTYYENGADVIGPNRAFGIVAPIASYTMNEAIADNSVQKMGVIDLWKDLYKIVLNANIVMDNVEGNEKILPEIQDEMLGETLFLRSLAYYHLTNLWGDVPYYRDGISIDEISVLGRSDVNQIREDVLVDLQRAQDAMPAMIEARENGRASKWAAAVTMAKIYLIQQNWQQARDKCLEIINGSSHTLAQTYAEVFDPANEYNDEVIWELDFAKDIHSQYEEGRPDLAGNGNWYASMFSPRLRDEPKSKADKNALKAALAANGEAMTGTGLQVPLPDFVNKFPVNDLRRPLYIQDTYEGIQLKFPYMPKFWNLNVATSPRFNHSDNKLVYRLADIYLMAAEAENELNGPTNAYQYIHPIRQRAYATQVEWELVGLTQESFRQAVRDERKWELAGESHRRMDLIRWGILLDVVAVTEYRVYDPASFIKPYHVLLPIPLQEVTLNPNLLESDPTNNGYR